MSAISTVARLYHVIRTSIRLLVKACRLVTRINVLVQASTMSSTIKTRVQDLTDTANALLTELESGEELLRVQVAQETKKGTVKV